MLEAMYASDLDRLAQLEDGWNNGEGYAMPKPLLEFARGFFVELVRRNPKMARADYAPDITPCFRGGIDIVWCELRVYVYLARDGDLFIDAFLDHEWNRAKLSWNNPEASGWCFVWIEWYIAQAEHLAKQKKMTLDDKLANLSLNES